MAIDNSASFQLTSTKVHAKEVSDMKASIAHSVRWRHVI